MAKKTKKRLKTRKRPKFARGTMVFWLEDKKPWWIVEWQPDNGIGGSYWITDYIGTCGGAGERELSLFPEEAPALQDE